MTVAYHNIYFVIKKTTKQNKTKQDKKTKKAKKTKKEKRIFVENLTGYDDIACEFALCIFPLFDQVVNFSWLFIWIQSSLCATREEITVSVTLQLNIKYTLSRTKMKANH